MTDDRAELEIIREAGWSVAVHNDYTLSGERFTFWLFTHPNGRWVKGEGRSDEEALEQIRLAIAALESPPARIAREEVARVIYEKAFADLDGFVPWVERGNSTRQSNARWAADGVLALLPVAEGWGTPPAEEPEPDFITLTDHDSGAVLENVPVVKTGKNP